MCDSRPMMNPLNWLHVTEEGPSKVQALAEFNPPRQTIWSLKKYKHGSSSGREEEPLQGKRKD